MVTSIALKKYYEEHDHHGKGKKGKFSYQYGVGGTKITMTNQFDETRSFPSINSARLQFRVRLSAISQNINKSIVIKGEKWFIQSHL